MAIRYLSGVNIDSNTLFVDDVNNRVGIGTASPGSTLDVLGKVSINGDGTLNWGNAKDYGRLTWDTGKAIVRGESGKALSLGANGTQDYLYINTSGNVGIGTTSPSKKLQVAISDSAHADEGILLQSPSGYGEGAIYHDYGQSNGITAFKIWNTYTGSQIALSQDTYSSTGSPGSIRFYTSAQGTANAPSERMRITSAGNVGIGTTSPSVSLHTVGDGLFYSNTNTNLTVNSNGGAASLTLTNTAGNQVIYGGVGGSNNMDFYTGSTFRMRIDPSGNVGIGTTSPYEALDIVGNIRIGNYTTAGTRYIGYANNTFGDQFIAGMSIESTALGGNYSQKLNFATHYYGVSAGVRMTIDEVGNVGIGTTSPGAKLQLGSADTASELIRLSNIYDTGRSARGGINWHDTTNTTGRIYTEYDGTMVSMVFGSLYNSGYNSNNLMIIRGNGNVGIGTTSPDTKLSIQNDSATTNAGVKVLTLTQSTSGTPASGLGPGISFVSERPSGNILLERAAIYGIAGTDPNYDGDLAFYTRTDTGAIGVSEKVRITSDGNVGIGTTSPVTTLQVNATSPAIRLQETGSGGDKRLELSVNSSGVATIAANQSAQVLTFETVGSERMRISSTGATRLNAYGSGSFTGTVAYNLAVDSSGNVIETAGGVVDGSGTANYVTKWIDGNTVGNSLIYDDGTTITFQTGASERMRITSAGNVGIGTTSPGAKLHVDDSSADAVIRISKGASTIGNIDLVNEGNRFSIQDDGVRRFVIDTSGNVGIGTTSPSQKFVVSNGSAEVFKVYSTGEIIADVNYIYAAASGTSLYCQGAAAFRNSIYNDSATYLQISGGSSGYTYFTGNVGIGTTSPTVKLQVDNNSHNYIQVNSSVANVQTAINVTNSSSTSRATLSWEDGTRGAYADLYSSTYLSITTQSSEKMRITSAGNVGIGTTSPSNKLTIVSSAQNSGLSILDFNGAAGWGGGINLGVSGLSLETQGKIYTSLTNSGPGTVAGDMRFQTANSGALSDKMTITAAGNVGIGTTSPAAKLHVSGGEIRVDAGQSITLDTSNVMYLVGASNQLRLYNGANPVVNITTAGNVGIGTTSPGSLLHVYGANPTVKVQGSGTASAKIDLVGPYTVWTLENQYINGATNDMFRIYNSELGADAITINRLSNNVGIGTTSPSYKLDVAGTSRSDLHIFRSNQSAPTADAFIFRPADNTVALGTANSERIRVGSSEVWFKIGSSTTGYEASFSNDDNGFNIYASRYGGTGKYLTLNSTGAVENMRLISNGNVGIGTTSPLVKLHVDGTGTQYIRVSSSDNATFQQIGAQSGGTFVEYKTLYRFVDTDAGERMRITSDGTVGIGTTSPSSSYKLDVAGAIRTTDVNGYSIDVSAAFGDNSGASISILNRGTTRALRILGSSNNGWGDILLNSYGAYVGIGTTTPTQTLHVSGNVRVTGAYYDSNNSAGSSGQVLSSTGSGTDWVSLSEITGVDGTGTANYIAKWSDTDTITNSQIRDDGTTVGVGQAPAAAKMSVNGALNVGGRYLYNNFQSSLDTTGVAVAGLSASTNGDSAFFTFEAGASNGQYQRIVWSCYNTAGDWNVVKVIDEGTNAFDVVASASSGATITFTWKSRSGILYFTPRLIITGVGSINTSYL